MKTTYQKIQQKSKTKPISCKCNVCKKQCFTAPCLGTPEDILKLIEAGYGKQIMQTTYGVGLIQGLTDSIITMYQAEFVDYKQCTFLNNDGLCSLHNLGLKPTEGKLSHHNPQSVTNPQTNLNWLVAKEWIDLKNKSIINKIEKLLSDGKNS